MKPVSFCQSCSMPLTPDVTGTEKNGAASLQYCKFCYENGVFTHPDLKMEEMRKSIIERMDQRGLPEDIIEAAVKRLPGLLRWKKPVIHTENIDDVISVAAAEKVPLHEPPPPAPLANTEEELDVISGEEPEMESFEE